MEIRLRRAFSHAPLKRAVRAMVSAGGRREASDAR